MSDLYKLRAFIKPYLPQIFLSFLNLAILTALSLAVPRIIQNVVDQGLALQDTLFLSQSAFLLLTLGLITALLSGTQRYLSEWVSAHIGYDLRNNMYDHVQYLSFTYHDHSQTGQLISRCIEDVRSIERFSGNVIIELAQFFMLTIGILVLMLTANFQLALISLIPMIPLVWITFDFGGRITKLFFAVDHALGDLSSRLQENVSGAQVIRAFAREAFENNRFDESNKIYYAARVTVISEWAKVMPTTNLLISAGTLLILWFGGQMVLAGEMTIGEIVAFNAYLLMLSAPAQQLTVLVNAAGEATAGAQRLLEVLETPAEINSPADAIKLPELKGQVEFRNVSLKYQGEKTVALEGINLQVEPNQIIALIGQTGSGKTSLVNLIPRFYDANTGQVLVDNQDVRRLDLYSLRKQIGLVLQSSLLFSDSIRANIAYGRPEATEEEVIAAAKAAQAHEFIEQLEQGYETVVGERGITLSGGQRQRVAIARALLMNPRILILDDSLSSVDTQTEQLIQKALDVLMAGRTTFVIAHRLSTVRRANLILVMDKGRIVQRGSHEQLLKEGGLYREIHDLQLVQQNRFLEEMETLENRKEENAEVNSNRGEEF